MSAFIVSKEHLVEWLKLIDCLEYLSCEHDELKASEAHAILQTMRSTLIRALEQTAWDL